MPQHPGAALRASPWISGAPECEALTRVAAAYTQERKPYWALRDGQALVVDGSEKRCAPLRDPSRNSQQGRPAPGCIALLSRQYQREVCKHAELWTEFHWMCTC